jgi:phage terminase large subunit-like protein
MMTAKKNMVRAMMCEHDGLYFNRYFMKQQLGCKMLVGPHHRVMQDALDRTMLPPDDPEFISRLIINVPPGFTKTLMSSIYYIARGLAINSRARFLHLSYSDDLALINSSAARDIVRSNEYQQMWQVSTRDDTDSKKTWWTEKYGGVRAAATGGQVTGFRAGHMISTHFTGACLVDDPNKPDDARHPAKRQVVNDRYNETISSRLTVETIPIIVIQQRVHYDDLSGYLLRGGSGEKWHHLNLPVVIDNSKPYPEKNTHGIPIAHGLPDGWLWPEKLNETHRAALESHRRKWKCQYMQDPPERESDDPVWTEEDVRTARDLYGEQGDAIRTVVSVDPAATNSKTSDEHGIVVCSEYPGDNYSVDVDLTRKGTPKQWAQTAINAHDDYMAKAIVIETNQGGDMCEDTLRNAGFRGKIIRVHASKGKVTRAEPIAALYSLGKVSHAPGLKKLEDEMLDLDPVSGLANGKSPNRVDAAVWGLTELSKRGSFHIS